MTEEVELELDVEVVEDVELVAVEADDLELVEVAEAELGAVDELCPGFELASECWLDSLPDGPAPPLDPIPVAVAPPAPPVANDDPDPQAAIREQPASNASSRLQLMFKRMERAGPNLLSAAEGVRLGRQR